MRRHDDDVSYHELIESLSIGFFGIRLAAEDGPDRIEDCNAAFAKFFGYTSPSELLGRRPDMLFESEERWKTLVAELIVPGDPPETRQVSVTTRQGDRRTAAWTARLTEDHADSRRLLGTVRDVTSDQARRAGELFFRRDLGQFLHTLTSSLMSFQHVLEQARNEVQDEPQPEVRPGDDPPSLPSLEQDVAGLEEVAAELDSDLLALVRLRDEQLLAEALTAEAWDRLEDSRRLLLDDHTRGSSPGIRQAVLTEMARQLVDTLSAWQADASRDLVRPVLETARRLRRLGTLSTINQAEARLLEMDSELHRLRDLVVLSDEPEQRRHILFGDLVRREVEAQSRQARRLGLELRCTLTLPEFADREVWVEPRSVRRAIANLIHNAIKYSSRRAPGYVLLEGLTRDGFVGLRLTNYGVPIAADEIEHVFTMGFRGRYAASRHRQGSGVSLWDSKQVAERHGGMMTLSSTPLAGVSGDPTQPYLTRVEFWIADESGEP